MPRTILINIDDSIDQYCFAKSKGSIFLKCIWKLAFKDTYVKENESSILRKQLKGWISNSICEICEICVTLISYADDAFSDVVWREVHQEAYAFVQKS